MGYAEDVELLERLRHVVRLYAPQSATAEQMDRVRVSMDWYDPETQVWTRIG